MANNVQFQSSVPATPSSATIVETIDQGAGIQRQRVSVGDILAGTTIIISCGTVTHSSAALVTPSSNVNVVITGVPSVTISSGTVTLSSATQVTLTSNTVTLSSNPTVIASSAVTVTPSSVNTVTLSSAPAMAISSAIAVSSGTITLSSNPTVILSSNPTVTLSSAIAISSGTFTLSSNPTVIPSSVYTVTLSSNPTVIQSSVNTVTLSSNPTVILSSNPTVIPSSVISVMGDVANAATDSGNPVKIGGIYNSTNPTSVSSGQRVNAWFDKSGKQIVNSALRALKGVQLTAISCSVTETNITPSSTGGNFIDIYGLVLSNLSTNSIQQVTIKDSSGGTSRMIFEVPFSDTRGFMVPVDAAVPQAASSQAWTATLSNSSGPFQVTALYVTNI